MRIIVALVLTAAASSLAAQTPRNPSEREARDILAELVGINTTYQHGSTTPAARAVARRFLDAGFPAGDVRVIGPDGDKDSNVVVRYPGSDASLKPILLMAHLDVVEALRADWSVDPFTLTEKDGFFYGRGTSDIKDGAATLVEALLRMKRERVRPRRTLVLMLTAGEEGGGGYNGASWLVRNHRDLVNAELALNVDGGDPLLQHGKRVLRGVQSSEKLFQSFWLEVTNPGGHSSRPRRDNAIVRLAAALTKVGAYEFPVHLNETTRGYFARTAALATTEPADAADMRAVAASEHDSAAVARLSRSIFYNAQLRTTCVPTMLEGGHAPNALPQRARALVNCRILPGETPEETRAALGRVVADDSVRIAPIDSALPAQPSPLSPLIMGAVHRVSDAMTPGLPIVPQMETGATDGAQIRPAGIPTYGVSGVFLDVDDERAHGRDERIIAREFYDGTEFIYRLVRDLAGVPVGGGARAAGTRR
ncbi:MAG TPA: M20/M25/M40 family metallo-hydrolase [Gemmatimonadaceae bacterium]|nr:M20/M25/M40 family metallo-hydrolase [Gemmatimonadaceae bacterium]